MGVSTYRLLDQYLAAPRGRFTPTSQRANARRQSAGRRAPARLLSGRAASFRRARVVASLGRVRRMFSPSLLSADRAARSREGVPSTRLALDALGAIHRAVHTDLHNAGRSRSTGELRDH